MKPPAQASEFLIGPVVHFFANESASTTVRSSDASPRSADANKTKKMIIPPKLKILAGFKADDDVTIEQVITALEEKFDARVVSAKFQRLLNERALQFPSEKFDESFVTVANSAEGSRLLSGMKRSVMSDEKSAPTSRSGESAVTERYDPELEEDSKQKFVDLAERLNLESPGLDAAGAWAYASMEHPEGKKLFATWKQQSLLKKKIELARAQQARSPHLYPQERTPKI